MLDGKICEELKEQKRNTRKIMPTLKSALVNALDAHDVEMRMALNLAK